MRVASAILLMLSITGCSVIMAMEGDEDRDYSSFRPGSPREDVLARFGTPETSVSEGAKTIDTYKIEEGDVSNPSRGLIHLLADLATLGAWEVFATPFEWTRGREVLYRVVYGPDSRIEEISPTPPWRAYSAEMGFASLPSVTPSPPTSSVEDRPTASVVDDVPELDRPTQRRGHAVIVGIESYRGDLPAADHAAHDARIVSEYVTDALGYPKDNVVLLVDEKATRADFHKYFESWLPNRVEPSDSVFIYYSGHGAPSVTTRQAYLVPHDGDPHYLDKTGYSLDDLYEHLSRLPAKEVVVVLDSCFSGMGGRSVIAQGLRPIVLAVENPLLIRGRTVVLGASASTQVAHSYEKEGHGLLTYFFLKGLQGEGDLNRDGSIEIMELYSYVRPRVQRTARREYNNDQVPQLFGSPDVIGSGIRLLELDPLVAAQSSE